MFYFTVKHVNISVFFCVKNCVIEGNSKDEVTLHQNLFLGTLFPLIFSQQASLNGGWPLPNNRMFVYYSALINLSNDVYRRMPYLWKCLALVLILPLFLKLYIISEKQPFLLAWNS